MTQAPLAGIRVLDLTRLLPGPLAAQHLAHLGAEVIKIEDRAAGDYARTMNATDACDSQFFLALNRNKAFVTLDLKHAAERDAFLGLIATSDIVVEGFRPGVMARLGLGYDTLCALNPALVLCSITGYGQDGPWRDQAGHDINYLSCTGFLHQNVGACGEPAMAGLQVADLLGGSAAALIGVLAALFDARRSGRGRHVDISMTDVVMAHNVMALAHFNQSGERHVPGQELLTGGEPCYNLYRCQDDRHMAVGALEAKFWDQVCDIIGLGHLKACHWSRGQRPGSETARAATAEVRACFARATQAQWCQRFGGSDCCVTPVLSVEEALGHPLFAARKMFETVATPHGPRSMAAFPIRFVGEAPVASVPARERGADQEAVLSQASKLR